MLQVKVFRSEGHINDVQQQAKKWIEENGVEVKELKVAVSPDQGHKLVVYYESKTLIFDENLDSTDFSDMLRYLGHYQG